MQKSFNSSVQHRIHEFFVALFPLVLLLFAGVSIYTNKMGLGAIIAAISMLLAWTRMPGAFSQKSPPA